MAARRALPVGRVPEAGAAAGADEPAADSCTCALGAAAGAATGLLGCRLRSGLGPSAPLGGGTSVGGGVAVAGAVPTPGWGAGAALGASGRGGNNFGSEAPNAGGP
eukprot:12706606-Alexandrium_andersonii.AAC.1